jgi:hypothetical protein
MIVADIQFNVDAALQKLSELVQAHGQSVMNTAITVERMSALNSLFGAAGWGLTAGALVWGTSKLIVYWKDKLDKYDSVFLWIVVGVLWIIAGGMFIFGFVNTLFSAWTWIGLFDPKLALAHDIMLRLAGIG